MKQLSTRYDSLIGHCMARNPLLKAKEIADKILQYDGLDVTDETLTRMVKRYKKGASPVGFKYDGDVLIIVIGCLHFPFHNERFWGAFLNFLAWVDGQDIPYQVDLNGDILDCHSASRHSKGKIGIPGLTLGLEYALSNKEFDKLDQATPKAISKHYRAGNHERWVSQHLQEVDAAKIGDTLILPPWVATRLEERGYQVEASYSEGQFHVNDNTIIQHGTHLSIHAAHAAVQKMKCNVMFNHTHRATEWTERTQNGQMLWGVNAGWGGNVNAPVFSYMGIDQRRTWQNAFGMIHLEGNQTSPELIVSADSKSFWAFGKKFTD